MTVDRVHFVEAAYIGADLELMVPPVSDLEDPVRRKNWTIEENVRGDIVLTHVKNGVKHASRIPATNVRTVVYASVKA
jgi:hypothetical protein